MSEKTLNRPTVAKKRKPQPIAQPIDKLDRITCAACGFNGPRSMMRDAPEPGLVRCLNQVACRKRVHRKPQLELVRERAKQRRGKP